MFLQVRFQICCYLWGSTGVGPVNRDILYFSLLLLVAFVLKHNVNEKNMRNIDVRIHADLTYPLCGFNEQLRYYFESANRDFFRPTTKKFDPRKNLDPRKNF